MRKEFSEQVKEIIKSNNKTVFITCDLGFNVLEDIQQSAKDRFINAGVAEQNSIGVAAGLAFKGHETFVYNIASFAILRCLEQIKIDVCIHNLPVYIIGNGGGYGYGVMGVTHHALEDLGCVGTLPNIISWIPAFNEDVNYCLSQITSRKKPAYLRLGVSVAYPNIIKISFINHILKAQKPRLTIIALGPIIQNVLKAVSKNESVDVFTILKMPLSELSAELEKSILKTRKVLVVEEHIERGGLGEHLLSIFAKKTISLTNFVSLHAKGYPDNIFGDQSFHQKESGLDADNILKETLNLLND